MQKDRPSDKELDGKLEAAKETLRTCAGLFANPSKVVGELNALDIESQSQLWKLIIELLEEISPKDYAGTRPPQKSYEKAIIGKELFAFCWDSKKLRQKMYIKFALKDNRYYYLSLHRSKEPMRLSHYSKRLFFAPFLPYSEAISWPTCQVCPAKWPRNLTKNASKTKHL